MPAEPRHEAAGPGSALPSVEALGSLPDALLGELRSRLHSAGYGEALVAEAERVAPRQFDAVRLPLVHAWLERRGGPASTLAALFSYAAEASPADARAALGDALVGALLGAGVLAPSRGERLAARYRITPFDGLLFFSDPPEGGADTAMGPGITTATLSGSTSRLARCRWRASTPG